MFVLKWEGRTYEVSARTVADAFYKAGFGDFIGPHARYFIGLGGDLKSLELVLREIVPIPADMLTPEMAKLAGDMFEAMGFEVLDRRRHHDV